MASSKALCFIALTCAILAVAYALPGPLPGPAGPAVAAPARIQEKGEKSDLKAENSHGFGYAYGGYGPWGYGGYPYSYGYGYPYGYSYGYPYGYGWGAYGYPYY